MERCQRPTVRQEAPMYRLLLLGFVGVLSGACAGRVYTPGNDVSAPVMVTSARPEYTQAAMAARIEGIVWLDLVVKTDGSVGDVRVTRSLDRVHGLDAEAVRTVRLWRFKPALRRGMPVPVRVAANVEFTLR